MSPHRPLVLPASWAVFLVEFRVAPWAAFWEA
jgi:hypothetical protein